MKNTPNENEYSIRDALVAMWVFKNVNILHPTDKLMGLLSLSDEKLDEIWERKVSKVNLDTSDINLKLYKNNKKDKASFRVFTTRTFWKNWYVAHEILNNKEKIWQEFTSIREEYRKQFKIDKNKEIGKTFGYLPNVSFLKEYLKDTLKDAVNQMDHKTPFAYFDWKWSFKTYMSEASEQLKSHDLFKIDLQDAFLNLKITKLSEEVNSYSRINRLIDWSKRGQQGLDNKVKGIPYGGTMESYILANIRFMYFKYKLYKSFLDEGYEIGILSYVDDNYVYVKDPVNELSLEMFKKLLKKFFPPGKGGEFQINEEKTEFFSKGDFEALIASSSTYGGNPEQSQELFGDVLKTNKELFKNQSRILDGIILGEWLKEIRAKNGDISQFIEKNLLEIFSSKYANKFFNILFLGAEKRYVQGVLRTFIYHIENQKDDDSLVEPEGINAMKLKFADILLGVYSKDYYIMQIIKSIIKELTVHNESVFREIGIREESEYMKLTENPMMSSEITIFESFEVIGKVLTNSINKTSSYQYDDKVFYDLESVEIVNEQALYGWLDFPIQSISNEEFDVNYYFSKYKIALQKAVLFRENSFMKARFQIMVSKSKSRLELSKNLGYFYQNTRKLLMDEKATLFSPTVFNVMSSSDIEFMNKISIELDKRDVAYSIIDTILITREFLDASWKNGSRELEHFSNHALQHSDNLFDFAISIMASIKTETRLNYGAVILSIYMHDFGLLDDELFFDKSEAAAILSSSIEEKGIERYKKLKDSMSNSVREAHGVTSANAALKIYHYINHKKFLRNKTFDIATKASSIHNGTLETYHGINSLDRAEYFIVSLLDLADVNWKRIERPINSIGTSTATPTTKKFWIKDLIVEKMTKKFTIYNGANKQKELLVTIHLNENMLREIEQRIISNKWIVKEKSPLINHKFLIWYFFETEFLYINDDIRDTKYMDTYTFEKKLGIKTTLAFKVVKPISRRVDYKTIKMNPKKGESEFILWIDEVFEGINKSVVGSMQKFITHKELSATIDKHADEIQESIDKLSDES